jgi:hypothetical protein
MTFAESFTATIQAVLDEAETAHPETVALLDSYSDVVQAAASLLIVLKRQATREYGSPADVLVVTSYIEALRLIGVPQSTLLEALDLLVKLNTK